jgi:hypothetical protein
LSRSLFSWWRRGAAQPAAGSRAIFEGVRRSVVAVTVAGVVLVAGVAAVGAGMAVASNDQMVGVRVSDEQSTAIASAVGSCPMLTSARLAGQLMVESGLNNDASRTASGGQGIAGFNGTRWKQWAPWPDASRSDVSANVIGLAHQMCDLSGQLRLAGVPGDSWHLSLAAYRSSLDKVKSGADMSKSVKDYVDKSSSYADYYGKLPQFGGHGTTASASAAPTDAKPLPQQDVAPVLAAGKVCPQVSSASVAALLMASSGLDANKLGAGGRQGIAQFLPEVWQSYSAKGASPWDSPHAIPVVGSALCGMAKELSGLPGDPFMLAVSAFRAGPMTVRQDGGASDADTKSFLDRVSNYSSYYALDSRLKAAQPAGTPTSKPAPPATSRGATVPVKPSQSPKAHTPDVVKPTTEDLPGQLVRQEASGKCLDAGVAQDGTYVVIHDCSSGSASQRWYVGDDGTIRSVFTGRCLDVANEGTFNGALVQVADCTGNPAQQWKFNGAALHTTLSGKCADSAGDSKANGTRIDIQICVANDQQTWKRTN